MSEETSGSENAPPADGGPSEHDAEELVRRLRSAPAEMIIRELFSTLLSTAQVKLGRRDARLFIDLCSQTLEYAGPHMPDDLVHQVEGALGQLRLAQVTAENELAEKGEPEPNDLSRSPAPPTAGSEATTESRHQQAAPPSRLWVPGR